MPDTSCLVIHFIAAPNEFAFENSLAATLRETFVNEVNLLEIDNFSDATTLHYASQLCQAKTLIIILSGNEEAPLGKASVILNQTIRHPNLRLYALHSIQSAQPYMVRHQGKRVKDLGEIVV